MTRQRRGFTLIELMIVLAIFMILAALIFPSFSAARENARQTSCSSNLREIGVAVQMYRAEQKEYPVTLASLLPAEAVHLDNATTAVTSPTPAAIDSSACDNTNPATSTCPNPGGTGLLRGDKYLLCPDDRTSSSQPRSSYGDISTSIPAVSPGPLPSSPEDLARRTWNAWGYDQNGLAYESSDKAAAATAGAPLNTLLVDPARQFVDPNRRDKLIDDGTPLTTPNQWRTNVVKNSLSNRFASPNTIITYCPFHRIYSSNLSTPEKLYDSTESANIAGARDLILRLDGTVKSVVTTTFNQGTPSMWQTQDFR